MNVNHENSNVFDVKNLGKSYRLDRHHRVHVLDGLDLTVRRGEWLALTGASGSGKTTLLHLLAGLDKADCGSVVCFGRSLERMSESGRCVFRRRRIGLVFQQYHLLPELSAVENVALPARTEMAAKNAANSAIALLEQFGLGARLNHRPQELSGGEQQRVAMARALINEPDVILADEPTGNLDDAAAAGIMETLESLCRDEGKTLVFITHDLELAARADRVCHLVDGGIPNDQMTE